MHKALVISVTTAVALLTIMTSKFIKRIKGENVIMKKTLKGYVLGILTAVMLINTVSYAYNRVRIVVDNREITPTDSDGNRVDPIIVDGTTYLPVRAVANAFGKAVYWDGETSTVYLGDRNGILPYPTDKLVDMKNIGDGWGKSNTLTDNYGGNYSNAVVCYGNYKGQYILNGKYSRLRGTLYVKNGETYDRSAGIVITADGKDIFTSQQMTKISRPITIDISVKGCNVLEIEHTGQYFDLLIGDAGLYQ